MTLITQLSDAFGPKVPERLRFSSGLASFPPSPSKSPGEIEVPVLVGLHSEPVASSKVKVGKKAKESGQETRSEISKIEMPKLSAKVNETEAAKPAKEVRKEVRESTEPSQSKADALTFQRVINRLIEQEFPLLHDDIHFLSTLNKDSLKKPSVIRQLKNITLHYHITNYPPEEQARPTAFAPTATTAVDNDLVSPSENYDATDSHPVPSFLPIPASSAPSPLLSRRGRVTDELRMPIILASVRQPHEPVVAASRPRFVLTPNTSFIRAMTARRGHHNYYRQAEFRHSYDHIAAASYGERIVGYQRPNAHLYKPTTPKESRNQARPTASTYQTPAVQERPTTEAYATPAPRATQPPTYTAPEQYSRPTTAEAPRRFPPRPTVAAPVEEDAKPLEVAPPKEQPVAPYESALPPREELRQYQPLVARPAPQHTVVEMPPPATNEYAAPAPQEPRVPVLHLSAPVRSQYQTVHFPSRPVSVVQYRPVLREPEPAPQYQTVPREQAQYQTVPREPEPAPYQPAAVRDPEPNAQYQSVPAREPEPAQYEQPRETPKYQLPPQREPQPTPTSEQYPTSQEKPQSAYAPQEQPQYQSLNEPEPKPYSYLTAVQHDQRPSSYQSAVLEEPRLAQYERAPAREPRVPIFIFSLKPKQQPEAAARPQSYQAEGPRNVYQPRPQILQPYQPLHQPGNPLRHVAYDPRAAANPDYQEQPKPTGYAPNYSNNAEEQPAAVTEPSAELPPQYGTTQYLPPQFSREQRLRDYDEPVAAPFTEAPPSLTFVMPPRQYY